MKMQHVTIQTPKFEESVEFYQKAANLSIHSSIVASGIIFLKNDDGDTAIELINRPDSVVSASGISIGFHTEDVDAHREKLIEMGYTPGPMISPHPEVKFFFLEDPNGISVQFI